VTRSLDSLQERSDERLHIGRHGGRKAGGCVIVIRWGGLEALVTSATRSILHSGNPGSAMFSCDVHPHVVLHFAAVVAAGASPGNISVDISRIGNIPVDLGHVLIESTLLDEVLCTNGADMGLFPGMLLLMVVHSVLFGGSEIAVVERTSELTCVIFDIYDGCHTHGWGL
jgi:hypothetical protein